MINNKVFKILRILYLIWVFYYCGWILVYTIDPITHLVAVEDGIKPSILDYINAFFLIIGAYYMIKYFSKQ